MKKRSKPDYFLKSILIAEGLDKEVGRLSRKRHINTLEGVVYDPALENEYANLIEENGYLFVHEAQKINNAYYRRVQRLKDRIFTYLQMGECIWLTLTFSEEVLNSTSVETRRKYVQRYLKSQSNYYLANIDFGKTTEREHYHAILVSSFIDKNAWDYGFTWTERIKNHTSSEKKLAKYVSKLTNHAIKETTKRQCYIYSRN